MKGAMSMLIAVTRYYGELKVHNFDYYDLSPQERIHILDCLLDDSFEIYFRNDTNEIMLYNLITGEYIDNNQEAECDLQTIWQCLILEHCK